MIQKGIIESIENAYQVKVRIPKYDKTNYDGIKNGDLSTAIICSMPGTVVNYDVGDVVLVGFENDELSKPIILGSLYRDSELSSSIVPYVDDSLSKIQEVIDNINSSFNYTHIKYSNDNGKTFTSLYDYADIKKSNNSYYTTNIKIDNESNTVVWTVLNDNNADITSHFDIKTYIHNHPIDDTIVLSQNISDETVFMSTDTSFKIPVKLLGSDELFISYVIQSFSDINDYYMSLTTDKNDIGSVYGDYIGICVNNNYEPSYEVTDYSWSSSLERNTKIISETTDDLLKRLEEAEQSLYGFNKSSEQNSTDLTGLLDGFTVDLNSIKVGESKNKFYLNNNETMYVDNRENSLTLNKVNLLPFILKKTSKGHLNLSYKVE